MLKKDIILFLSFAMVWLMAACQDDDSFTTSPSNLLTFSTDTVKLDTLFSNVPSAAKTLWAFNRSGDGLRCTSIRLERGAQSGFRVNVDGIYLGEDNDYSTNEVEVRNKDSIRVFIEATLPTASIATPEEQSDNLIFTLESGVEQRVNLNAWAWNARLLRNVHITKDSTLDASTTPTVIYGDLRVDSGATLTITPGSTLYFHSDAGMDVYGRLRSIGTAGNGILLRGDRIDHMFNYLPYDRVPAQWMGVRFHSSSFDNELRYTELHSTNTAITVDSSDVARQTLLLSHATIHNCQGYGLVTTNAKVTLEDVQITNTLNDCLLVNGGDVSVNNATLAQFYPFDSQRGAALAFNNSYPIVGLSVTNSLLTGYADNVLMGSAVDTTALDHYLFDYCIIRTPKVTTADSVHFTNVIYEDVKDTTTMGEKHFYKIDTDNRIYDFRLDSVSAAIGKANPATALPDDRLGVIRKKTPDIGAYEYIKPED
jgi:hypothetical protein